MLSIIICSRSETKFTEVCQNISSTVGIPFEIIKIDNAHGNYGICAAYNEGISRSVFPYLCFMHEDVSVKTRDWGKLLIKHLLDPSSGLIGIAGGDAKSRVPSSWSIPLDTNHIHLIQHYKNGEQNLIRIGIGRESISAVAVDGVWMATRREVAIAIKFDQINFPGFHGYDIDFSLQVLQHFQVRVIPDILIAHFSEGNPDREWLKAASTLSNKWAGLLPVYSRRISKKEMTEHHWKTLWVFLSHMIRLDYPPLTILQQYLKYACCDQFHIRRFLSLCKYLVTSLHKKNKGMSFKTFPH
jgi:GT2 family glycosyltransferase